MPPGSISPLHPLNSNLCNLKGISHEHISAASLVIQWGAGEMGHWDALISVDAKASSTRCGPCIDPDVGLLEEGEMGISATNRNYRDMMGYLRVQACLVSLAVIVASAIKHQQTCPNWI